MRNSRDSQFPRFTAWSRESSSFGVDCLESPSLVDVVGKWHEICSVREQFLLFVYKRLTKTAVEFKVNRHSSVMIIAILQGVENWFSPLTMQTALFCITCCLPSSCRPRCALVWGTVVRGLRVEIFVRVLCSSRLKLK